MFVQIFCFNIMTTVENNGDNSIVINRNGTDTNTVVHYGGNVNPNIPSPSIMGSSKKRKSSIESETPTKKAKSKGKRVKWPVAAIELLIDSYWIKHDGKPFFEANASARPPADSPDASSAPAPPAAPEVAPEEPPGGPAVEVERPVVPARVT